MMCADKADDRGRQRDVITDNSLLTVISYAIAPSLVNITR